MTRTRPTMTDSHVHSALSKKAQPDMKGRATSSTPATILTMRSGVPILAVMEFSPVKRSLPYLQNRACMVWMKVAMRGSASR
jgi:hypothetical protein